jgi:hypothetical protein
MGSSEYLNILKVSIELPAAARPSISSLPNEPESLLASTQWFPPGSLQQQYNQEGQALKQSILLMLVRSESHAFSWQPPTVLAQHGYAEYGETMAPNSHAIIVLVFPIPSAAGSSSE